MGEMSFILGFSFVFRPGKMNGVDLEYVLESPQTDYGGIEVIVEQIRLFYQKFQLF